MGFLATWFSKFLLPGVAVLSVATAVCQSGQIEAASAPVVPQTIKYDGMAVQHARETVEIAFRIYSSMDGGEPMLGET
jgi:hypothetical protein